MWCVDDFILTRWTWKVFKKRVERLVTSKRYGKTDSDKTLSFSSFYQSCTWCFEACDHLLNSCYPGIQSYCQKMSGVSNQVLSKSIEVLLPFSETDSIPRVSWPSLNSEQFSGLLSTRRRMADVICVICAILLYMESRTSSIQINNSYRVSERSSRSSSSLGLLYRRGT